MVKKMFSSLFDIVCLFPLDKSHGPLFLAVKTVRSEMGYNFLTLFPLSYMLGFSFNPYLQFLGRLIAKPLLYLNHLNTLAQTVLFTVTQLHPRETTATDINTELRVEMMLKAEMSVIGRTFGFHWKEENNRGWWRS